MNKKLFFKSLALLVLMLVVNVGGLSAELTTIFSENFEKMTAKTTPTGWSISGSTVPKMSDRPDYVWGVYQYKYQGVGNKTIRMYNGAGSMNGHALIKSPSIQLPTTGPCQLQFKYSHRADCTFIVKISTNNGSTWTDLCSLASSGSYDNFDSGTMTEKTIDLASYLGKTAIIQFYAYANEKNPGAIFVDDVMVLGPAVPKFIYTLSENVDESYSGEAKSVSVTVTTPATGVTVQYSTNKGTTWADGSSVSRTNVGTDSVIFKLSAAGYTDSITNTVVLKVNAAHLSSCSIAYPSNQTYTGDSIKPDIDDVRYGDMPLVKGTDYTYEYANNVNVGEATVTVTGMGNFTGSDEHTFTIDPASIANATIAEIPDATYTGSEIKPALTITFNGDTLVENTDYTVAYSDNVNEGTATATATGIGNFTGTASKNFTIVTLNYLHFVALNDGDTVRLDKYGDPDAINLEYSTDKTNWTAYSWTDKTGASISLANKNETVWFRAGGTGTNATFSKNNNYYYFAFGTNDSIAAGGNIMSLYDKTCEQKTMTNYGFYCLFKDCKALVTAPVLPAHTLTKNCYNRMFYGCTSLTTAPELPAQTLADNCYDYMFYGCTSLTEAPVLPAQTLAQSCYSNMFNGCIALTEAPVLPAQTLAKSCYSNMFKNCSSLYVDTMGTSCNGTGMSFPKTDAQNWNSNMFKNCHGNSQCTAQFGIQAGMSYCVSEYIPRQVTVSVNDAAMGSVTGAGTYQDGTEVTLTATANEGYAFKAWSNGETANPYSFVVTSDTTLTATFESEASIYHYTTNTEWKIKHGYDGGWTWEDLLWESTSSVWVNNYTEEPIQWDPSTGGINIGSCATCLIKKDWFTTAEIANAGNFSSGDEIIVVLRVIDDVTVKLTFLDPKNPVITSAVNASANSADYGYVEKICQASDTTAAGRFYNGTTITLVAHANSGYEFVNWSNGATTDTLSFVVASDTTLTANFEAVVPTPALLPGKFSVSESKQVQFSKGNLQATVDASGKPTAWNFAANQYGYIGNAKANTTIGSEAGVVDLFGWSTSSTSYGISISTDSSDYSGDFVDWGKNTIANGEDTANQWNTLSSAEWTYLLNTRTVNGGTGEGKSYQRTTLTLSDKTTTIYGLIFAPDNYTGSLSGSTSWSDWQTMESAGCVFLPAAGYRKGTGMIDVGSYGYYWSATPDSAKNAYALRFRNDGVNPARSYVRFDGFSVRLVQTYVPYDTLNYLHFVSLKDNGTVMLNKVGNPTAINLEYSTDKKSWTIYNWTGTKGDTIALANQNDTVWFRAGGDTHKNATLSSNINIKYQFAFGTNDSIAAGGNIMSLYDATCEQKTMTQKGFTGLFSGCKALVKAPILTATTLATCCYDGMFSACASLTEAPELPVTKLATYCYQNMFEGCKSLTVAPVLPAKTTTDGCYKNMFYNCTSLTEAPALPATNLANMCYQTMFKYCTSLYVDVSDSCNGTEMSFPKTTSGNSWWNKEMFSGCHGPYANNIQLGGKYCVSEYIAHQVTASVNDPTMGSVTGTGEYQEGTTATLTAVANKNHSFVQWSTGDTIKTVTVVVLNDTAFSATFAPNLITGITTAPYKGMYDAQSHNVAVSGTIDGDSVTYSTDSVSWSASFSQLDATAQKVFVKVSRQNYFDFVTSDSIVITKRSVILTSANATKSYKGTALTNDTVTVTGTDGWAQGEGATYNVTGSQTNVGSSQNLFTYTLTGPNAKVENYKVDTVYGTLTVTPASLSGTRIDPISNHTYTGDSIKPDLIVKYDTMTLVKDSDYTVVYSNNVNVGEATATITGKGNYTDSEAKNFNITPATITGITTEPYKGKYDGTSHSLTVSGILAGDDVKYSTDSVNWVASFDRNDASATKVFVKVARANYYDYVTSDSIVISKRSLTMTSSSAEKSYDGTALTNDEVNVTGDNWVTGEGATYNVTGSQTKVGDSQNEFTYTLTGATAKDENYDINKVEGTLTVTQNMTLITITADSASKKYDGTALTKNTYTLTGDLAQGDMLRSVTISGTITDFGEVANTIDTFAITTGDGENVTFCYGNIQPVNGKLSITKRPVTLTSATDNKSYDGTALTNSNVSVSGDGFVGGEGATYEVTGTQTAAGNSQNLFTYTLTGATAKPENYKVDTVYGTLTVTPAGVDGAIIAEVPEHVYNGSTITPDLTITYKGMTLVKDSDYTVSYANNVNVGQATATVTGKGNYNGTTTATFNITPATITDVTTTPYKGMYDGFSHNITVSGTLLSDTVKYSTDSVTWNASYSLMNAAAQKVFVKVARANFYNYVASDSIVISKRSVILTSASDTKSYDGTPLTNSTVTVKGDDFVVGEGATYDVTGTQTKVGDSQNLFTYTLTNATKADNYEVDTVIGTLSVTQNMTRITITASDSTKMYDGTAMTQNAYTYTGDLAQGDMLRSVTISGTITDFGEVANTIDTFMIANYNGEDVTFCYGNIQPVNGKLSITKRSITITTADSIKYYDTKPLINHKVEETGDGFVEGEGYTLTVTGTQTKVGESENTVTYTFNSNTKADNYDIVTNLGTLTVLNSVEPQIIGMYDKWNIVLDLNYLNDTLKKLNIDATLLAENVHWYIKVGERDQIHEAVGKPADDDIAATPFRGFYHTEAALMDGEYYAIVYIPEAEVMGVTYFGSNVVFMDAQNAPAHIKEQYGQSDTKTKERGIGRDVLGRPVSEGYRGLVVYENGEKEMQ